MFIVEQESRAVAAPPTPDAPARRRRQLGRVPLWFVVPALAVYAFVTLVPSTRGMLYAFSDWNGFSPTFNLIGFDNFVEIFNDPLAIAALANTFIFAAVTMVLQNLFGLLLALALNTVVKSAGVLRTIFFAPVVLTPLVCGYIWSYLLAPTGSLNTVLGAVGLESLQQNWLGDPKWALASVSAAYLWQFTGFSMVIYLAGLKALPAEVIEAAIIDGAGPVRRFFSVVLPLINGAVVITLLLTLINGLGQFDQVYAMTGGGPARATETIATVVFKVGYQGGRHAVRDRARNRDGRGCRHPRDAAVPRDLEAGRPMINRYTGRTLALEVGLWGVALLFMLPLFALVNMSLKAPHNSERRVRSRGAVQRGELRPRLAGRSSRRRAAQQRRRRHREHPARARRRHRSPPIRWHASDLAGRGGRSTSSWWGWCVPAQLGVLPLFLSMRDLGLNGSLLSVILAGAGNSIPFAVFVLTMFLRESPRDFEEAASLDGCGHLRTFWHIVVPLLRPAIGTVAILTAISIWNSFFIPLLFLSGTGNETLPVRISGFVRTYYADWPAVFAALVISAAPILVAYFALQKYIIQGFAGGLKG